MTHQQNRFLSGYVVIGTYLLLLVEAGKTENEIVAGDPASDFDAQWGHGRVQADDFVREVYASLTQK